MKTLKLILLMLLLTLAYTSCTDEIIKEEFKMKSSTTEIPIDSTQTFTGDNGTSTGCDGKDC